jgi:hypothetical protein
VNGKAPPLPQGNVLAPDGTANQMGSAWPLTRPMERMSLGENDPVMVQREVARDAAECRRALAAINAENKRRWRR